MYINVDKTKIMILSPTNLKYDGNLNLQVNKRNLESVTEFKYLGVNIDNNVNFKLHINKVCKQMYSRMYLINRYKYYFCSNWLKIFSTSLVLSMLDYCIPVWGNTTKNVHERIDKIIFKLAKLVIFGTKLSKTSLFDTLEKLNWLTSAEKYEVYSLNFIHKHIINVSSLTRCFDEFQKRPDSERSTRSNGDLNVPYMKTKFGQMAFFYQFSQAWNKLPAEIKEIQNSYVFDRAIRKLIVSKRKDIYEYSGMRIIS